MYRKGLPGRLLNVCANQSKGLQCLIKTTGGVPRLEIYVNIYTKNGYSLLFKMNILRQLKKSIGNCRGFR